MYPYESGASKPHQIVESLGGPFGSPVISNHVFNFSELGPPSPPPTLKPKKTLVLKEHDKLRRVTQIKVLLRIRNVEPKLFNTWFTDECWFTSDGIAQKKDGYYWALSKEAVKPVEFQEHPIKDKSSCVECHISTWNNWSVFLSSKWGER